MSNPSICCLAFKDQRSRYVETFKAAFAREEAKSLLARTAQKANGCAECVCLVAVERGRDNLVGTLDVRAPASSSESVTVDANGRYPNGVPEGHPDAVYVLNVCVSEDHRGCGIGTLLMLKACEDAHTRWGSKLVYTEVDTWNDAAYGLYLKLGFARVGGGGKEAPGSRDRLLLFAELPLQIHASKNIADTSATSL